MLVFSLGDSSVQVCSHCKTQVARKGEYVESMGRMADLVPAYDFGQVGERGKAFDRSFVVRGRVQKDQGKGPWDELFIEFDAIGSDGQPQTAWIAYAQGVFWFLQEFPIPALDVNRVQLGSQIQLGKEGALFQVSEVGTSRVLTAQGEFLAPIAPGSISRFADLSGPGSHVGTLEWSTLDARTDAPDYRSALRHSEGDSDFGCYVGTRLPADQVHFSSSPAGIGKSSEGLKAPCPNCGAPLEILSHTAERVVCAYCGSTSNVLPKGLDLVQKADAQQRKLLLPLGTKGHLRGRDWVVVGWMLRRGNFAGTSAFWEEFLLYSDSGYAWLNSESMHWVLAENVDLQTAQKTMRGETYRAFTENISTEVVEVLGEFYWRVAVGERSIVSESIAPPHSFVRELSSNEETWSYCTYIPSEEVARAFRLSLSSPYSTVVSIQPNPFDLRSMLMPFGIALAAIVGLWMLAAFRPKQLVLQHSLEVSSTAPSEFVSQPFEVTGFWPQTMDIALETNANNQWVGFSLSLVKDDGEIREVPLETARYSGVEGGESWSEGSTSAQTFIGSIAPGSYVLRGEATTEGSSPLLASSVHADLSCTLGARSWFMFPFGWALFGVCIPFLWVWVRKNLFEAKRWDQGTCSRPLGVWTISSGDSE